MKLRLEAISGLDGTGIVRAGQNLRLLRPPYTLQESPVLSEESVQDAVSRFGFSPSQQQFSNWEEAIEFLNAQVVEARRAIGKEVPESPLCTDIIEAASEEMLSEFFRRVESEFIPQRFFDHAENFLVAFLTSTALARYPALGPRAAKLLQSNKKARLQSEAAISQLACRDLRFPSLEKHGDLEKCARVAEVIKKRGSVFAAAS